MRRRGIYITEYDLHRLRKLMEAEHRIYDRDRKYLKELDEELARCKVVAPEKVPRDVITMNSQIRLKDLDSNHEMIYSLVFPGLADANRNKISILAPIGTALIGYKVGDTIEWKVPAGMRRLKVEEILYQPEAAGDYHL
ncbi:MAG: nucleoside diphosphate kinase regulator [bacterium]